MIITYEKEEGSFACSLFIPDPVPWKLESALVPISNDAYAFALVLKAGDLEDIVLTEDDVPLIGEDNDQIILKLFSKIVASAATAGAQMIQKNEKILDLGKIIRPEIIRLHKLGTAIAETGNEEDLR